MYTEQQIRGLAINFLRQHYKLRPRSGTSGTRVVPKVHYYQGVTIDARLAFQQPDLNWFTATVEATSMDTIQEVVYRTNWFRIFAYGVLSGLLVVGLFMALTQVQGFNLWQWFGGNTAFGALFLAFVLVTAIVSLLLSLSREFRYIYAVEQFKRFYANAQWIACDKEVLDNLPEKSLEELRRQCIQHGFGMLEILPGNRVRDLIEPSHIDHFAGRRSRLPLWVSAIQAPPKLRTVFRKLPFPQSPAPAAAPTKTLNERLADPLDAGPFLPTTQRPEDYAASVIRAKPGRPNWYQRPDRQFARLRWKARHAVRKYLPAEIRRRPGYFELPKRYFTFLAMALLAIITLSILQSSWSPTAKVGGRFETPDIAGLEPAANPGQSLASPDLLPGEYDHDFTADGPKPEVEYLDSKPEQVVEEKPREVARYRINQAGESRTEYQCTGLYQLPDTYYLLVTGIYADFPSAQTAANSINSLYQLAVTAAAEECLLLGGGKYYVYLDAPILEESQANFLVREYARRFELPVEVVVSE